MIDVLRDKIKKLFQKRAVFRPVQTHASSFNPHTSNNAP
jgi:hypothetical protein